MLKRALLALLACLPLAAGDPPTKPILRVETGMHLGGIYRISTNASGRFLATASHDKTLRLWDTATRELVRTFRPPIGEGDEGKVYACALSPDGRVLAAGGWTGGDWDGSYSIYLFDVTTGSLLNRIPNLPGRVHHLAYARDGRLVATLGSDGIRVFHPDGREAFRDTAYGAASHAAHFDGQGRLATSSFDGHIRLYGPEGTLRRKVQVGGRPIGIRFSPDGTRVALGFHDAPRVEVRSGADLSLLASPEVPPRGSLFSVNWSLDGETLYAFGSYQHQGLFQIRAWSRGGRGPWTDHNASRETGTDLAMMPDGRLAWGAADSNWDFLGSWLRPGAAASFTYRSLGLDAAGTRVRFHYDVNDLPPAVFAVQSRDLFPRAPELPGPRLTAPGLDVTDWKHTKAPKLNGTPLALEPGDTSHVLTHLPSGGFLLGADWTLYAFDNRGQARWKRPAPAFVCAVNASADGTLAVAAYGDGTIRWHRMSDGQELLAFFPHADGKRWVAWTPSGYYVCSPGGEELIGWHMNRGKDQAADFFPASRFRSTYYKPEIISKILETKDEAQALAALGGRADTSIAALLPPVVRILSPGPGARATTATVQVRASVRPPNGQAIDAVWAAVDGRRVDTRGLRPQQSEGVDKVYTLDVPVPSQDCTVSVFAQSGSAVSEAATLRLAWAGAAPVPPSGPADRPGAFVIQPKLYILAVGVGTYQRADLRLDFPGKDARDLAAAFQCQKGKLYRDVEVKLLADAQATKENILDGLEWLERQVTAKDVAVMFLAGHGINDTGGQYYFLPTDADPERIKRTMVADSDVRSTLAKLPGKVLFFLDTCHSGNVLGQVKTRGAADLNGFINELSSAENGIVVFSASTGKQSSQEGPEWGNGAFTKALVEGLTGKADFQKTGRITLNMLDLYLSERVKELTRGTQTPTTAKPTNVPDFPVAVVR